MAAPAGVKEIVGTHATVIQLSELYGLPNDEALLRRLGDKNLSGSINPDTQKPYIPKPVKRQFPISETLRGWIAFQRHQIEKSKQRRGFSDITTMEASEGAGIFTKKFLQLLKHSGCPGFHPSGRLEWDKLLPGIEAWLSGDNQSDKQELQREGVSSWSALREKYLAKSAKLEHDELDKRLMDADLASQLGLSAQAIFFALLDRLEVDFPARLAGHSAAEVKVEVSKTLHRIRAAVKKEFDAHQKKSTAELEKLQHKDDLVK